jgi:O-antigen ligase
MTAAPSLTQPTPRALEPTPVGKVAFYSFWLFNLAFYSRVFDWKFNYLHFPLITGMVALLCAGIDGRLLTTFRSKIGTCALILTLIYAVNVPLSTWRGDSLSVFVNGWLKSMLAFVIAGAVIVNFQQCRKALNSIGWGAGIASLLVNALGNSDGRLAFGQGTLGNSNVIAFILLLGLPFLGLMAADRHASKFKRLAVVLLTASAVVALLRTGSRTGLIGLGTLMLVWFLRSSILGKVAMFVFITLFSVAAVVALPHHLKQRYLTLFLGTNAVANAETQEDSDNAASAMLSSEERRAVLIQSLHLTFQHPLLGVGIGQFPAYTAKVAEAKGEPARWLGTHNTYTQISSEAGIPALICFLGMMVFSFNGVRKTYRRAVRSPTEAGQQIANICFAMMTAFAAYAVCAFFEYVAYEATLPVLAGFSIALVGISESTLAAAEKAQVRVPAIPLGQTAPYKAPAYEVNPSRYYAQNN